MKIPFFRTGTHTDSKGRTDNWSAERLDAIVSAYNDQKPEERHDAPLVIGHPKTDSPKFGSVAKIAREGDMLVAYADEVHPTFQQWLGEKLFDKVSAAFTGNKLRHIGFLGGTPPAIKGLPAFEFAQSEEVVEYEFSHDDFPDRWQWRSVKRMFQRLRDWIIEQNDIETADKVIGQWEVDNLEPPSNENSFHQHQETAMKTVEQLEQELATEKAKRSELETTLANERTQKRRNEITAFCESDAVKKKLNEQSRTFVAELMLAIDANAEAEFSEGDGKKKLQPSEALRQFVLALPDAVEFSAVATTGTEPKPDEAAAARIAEHANKMVS